jgi:signal transduction histidine kinase
MATTESQPRLVARFALGSLVAFLVIGAAVSTLTVRTVRDRAERNASFHAEFAARAVLAPILAGVDPSKPLPARVSARLQHIGIDEITSDGTDIRVKVWRPDGTVLWSDDASLIDVRFPNQASELREVLSEGATSDVSDLESSENVGERPLASKLFETYVPVSTHPLMGPNVVIELYQDYSSLQADVNRMLATLGLTFGAGLLVLYAVLLPIALSASRRLRTQNKTLHAQAEQLEVLLDREQMTVAELRRLNQMQGEFVAVASHELRSPLTTILGNLGTLERQDVNLEETVRSDMLHGTRQAAERLSRLVRNLLRASRIEDADQPLRYERVDLAASTSAVIHELPDARRRVDSSGLEALPSVRSDPERVEEILAYLVDNALKYSPDDAPVEITGALDGDEFSVEVRDRGIGIDEEDLGVIFERFRQLDQGTTRRYGGVGLGLFLARETAHQLGGRIEVESRPGHGSTFRLVLPAGRSGAAVTAAAASS